MEWGKQSDRSAKMLHDNGYAQWDHKRDSLYSALCDLVP